MNATPPAVAAAPSWRRYLLQSLLAGGCIVAIMLVLDLLLHTAIVTSLGATTFIVFAMPNAHPAQPRRLLGGYLAGAVSGVLCCLVAQVLPTVLPGSSPHLLQITLAGAAVALATLLMVSTHTEHPPAAGFALGLVLDRWTLDTLLFVAGAVLLLSGLRLILKRTLTDLV